MLLDRIEIDAHGPLQRVELGELILEAIVEVVARLGHEQGRGDRSRSSVEQRDAAVAAGDDGHV